MRTKVLFFSFNITKYGKTIIREIKMRGEDIGVKEIIEGFYPKSFRGELKAFCENLRYKMGMLIERI